MAERSTLRRESENELCQLQFEQTLVFCRVIATFDHDFLLRQIDPVPDHGQVELLLQVHLVHLQKSGQDLRVKLSLSEKGQKSQIRRQA